MAAFSSFFENQLIDWLLRGQSLDIGGGTIPPATAQTYIGLFTTTPIIGNDGVEVPFANNYSRVLVQSNTNNWASTSGASTTGVSSGSTSTTSNNIAIRFSRPNGGVWGEINGAGIFGTANSEIPLMFGSITPKMVANNSLDQIFTPGSLIFKLDQ